MAPVYTTRSSSSSTALQLPGLPERYNHSTEPGYSALTTNGESLFMCSSKEGHVCYHACRGHGRYPLWSDEEFMVDDVDEEEKKDSDDSYDSDYDFDSEEEWITDGEDHAESDREFWREIHESVERTRAQRRAEERDQRIYYSASDLRFLLTDDNTPADIGPIVGVIASKPPPEYVWYVADDNEAWMRGSQPQKLSEELDGAYYRYRYHVWDRIPNEDVRGSSDESSWEDEEEEVGRGEEEGSGSGGETRSWSELADIQEEQQQEQQQQQQEDQQPSC